MYACSHFIDPHTDEAIDVLYTTNLHTLCGIPILNTGWMTCVEQS